MIEDARNPETSPVMQARSGAKDQPTSQECPYRDVAHLTHADRPRGIDQSFITSGELHHPTGLEAKHIVIVQARDEGVRRNRQSTAGR